MRECLCDTWIKKTKQLIHKEDYKNKTAWVYELEEWALPP